MRCLVMLLITNSIFALSLPEAEQRALESSPAIRLGDLQSEQNDAQYAQALLSWFPEVTFGSMAAILQKPQKISHLQKQKHLFSNQFTLTQPIFSSDLFGNLKLSRLIKEGGAVGKEIAISETLYAVRTQYIQYGMKNQELALENVKLGYLQQAYQDETIRLKTGRSTQLQVAKAKAAISIEMSKQMNAQKESNKARHELALLLHFPPQEEAGLKIDPLPSVDDYPLLKEKQRLLQNNLLEGKEGSLFNEEEINNLIAQARANRPELKKMRLYVQAADAKRGQSRTQYLPEVSAFVDYGYYQPVNGQFFRQRNDWAGGVQLSWSLFDSLKREMKSKESVAFRKAALVAYEFENDKLEMTIRQDVQDIEEALFLYQNSQENLYLAQQTLEEAEVQFGAGGLNDLQLQDTKKFLSESEFLQTQAQVALLQKYYQLEHDVNLDLN